MIGALTVALCVGSALAGKSDDDVKNNLPKSDGNEGSYSNSGTKHVSASVECSSEAWADAYSSYKDSFIYVTKKVVVKACKFNGGKKQVKKMKKIIHDYAGVWAEATASASASCTSKVKGGGKASGCAVAEASAYAYEVAYLDAYVKAVAEAIPGDCGCAGSWSFGTAEFYKDLIAEVYAHAEAAACAEGNEHSSADAYVSCWADIYADVYVKAVAKAIIDADCYKGDKAKTKIKAIAEADIYYSDGCYIDENSKGTAGADGDGSSYTAVEDAH